MLFFLFLDMVYTFCVWVLDQLFWVKFEFDFHCCKVREGQPAPVGKKVAEVSAKAVNCMCDGIEFILAAAGVDVERADIGWCCFSIQCSPAFKIILPRHPVYEIIEEVAKAPEPVHEYFLGFLQHIKSGKYVYPEGGEGIHQKKLLLGPPVEDSAFIFRFHRDGSFEHDQSELFVHPDKGAAGPGHNLILHDGGHHRRLAWKLHEDGALEHVLSHLFVHVQDKQAPGDKSFLFLSTIGHQDHLAFRMVSFKPGSERRCLNNHVMRYRSFRLFSLW